MTLEEQLVQIDEAITAIMVAGQETKHEGMWMRRADLATLRKMRDEIVAEIETRRSGDTSVAVFDGR